MSRAAMDRAEFERALRDKGRYYHIHHPFHVAMYEGRASREQIQGWVANRFYYQVNIPLKDAAILANCPDREVRREWIQRILDHDGAPGEAGGIEAWLRLAEAVGLEREQVLSEERVLPGVRFAVDAYVNFARPGALSDPRGTGTHAGYPAIQAGRVVEHARRDEHGLRTRTPAVPYGDPRAGLASGAGIMSLPSLDSVPMLRRGFRFQFEPAQDCHVLLYPEGMVKLNDSAGEILKLVDGRRDVAAIVAALRERFPEVPGIDEDILAFLEVAHAQFWIELQ